MHLTCMSLSQKLNEKTEEKSVRKEQTAENHEKHIEITDIFTRKLEGREYSFFPNCSYPNIHAKLYFLQHCLANNLGIFLASYYILK